MTNNNIKVAIRNILANKKESVILMLGLAISLASAFFLYSYVYFEKNYDAFHSEADNLYRVVVDGQNVGDDAYKSPYSYSAQGPTALEEVPEVKDFTRLMSSTNMVLSTVGQAEENQVIVSDYYFTDDNFFQFFTYPLLQGQETNVLKEPGSLVIDKDLCTKLFGQTHAIGQKIIIDGEYEYTVTGVFEDVPANSHLKFKAILPLKALPWLMNSNNAWNNHAFFTYLQLIDGADVKKVEEKVTESYTKENRAVDQATCIWHLQAITDAYLHVDDFTSKPNSFKFGNQRMVYFLGLIAILILLVSLINYINLSTAKASERLKDILVRTTNGASRQQLFIQYFIESIVLNLFALSVSVLIIVWSLSFITQSGAFVVPGIGEFSFWMVVVSVAIVCLVLTSVVTASFIVVQGTIKKVQSQKEHFNYRRGLVVLQFIVIIVFITGIIGINKQLNHVNSIDLGFETEQMLVMNVPRVAFNKNKQERINTFRNELMQHAKIVDVTASVSIPGQRFGNGNGGPRFQNQLKKETYFRVGNVMPNYLDFYGIKLKTGRSFDGLNNQIIINKEAVAEFGFHTNEDLIDKTVNWLGKDYTIIGVTESFHQESLHIVPEPQIFYAGLTNNDFNYLTVKLHDGNIHQSISTVMQLYETHFPGNPIDYFFLDDFFNQQYFKDITFRNFFSLFSLLTLLIGFFGIQGLISYRITKRTKEIGIRKVNGAKIYEILGLLNKDFIKWMAIAFVIACPIAWYAMHKWLNNFAYKTNLSWWIFALAGIVALSIALLTVSWQSWRAARRNPVEALRYE
jgi:putative ABC transport system permease protein